MEWRSNVESVYEFLQFFGSSSIDLLWFPLLVWTVVSVIVFLILKGLKNLNPLYQYHLRVALIYSLPFGMIAAYLISLTGSTSTTSDSFGVSLFVVQNPIQLTVHAPTENPGFPPNWLDVNFIVGGITSFILIASFIFLLRLVYSYIKLRQLYKTLSKKELTDSKKVQLAFHDHTFIPFTFGWKKPLIVLPSSIEHDHEKVQMAIQHELVHINRGDYLLKIFLSLIESIFWFHPIMWLSSKEIETYREISCDQEVLNTTGISAKSYASMLYDIVLLKNGISSFSVSMAVQESTLKQRIESMKYHNLHKTSLKKSFLVFLSVTLLITLPIAYSDLQARQPLSYEQIVGETITLMPKSIIINDEVVQDGSFGGGTVSGSGSAYIGTPDNGFFVISLNKFEGAMLKGLISDNKLSFQINGLDVELVSNQPILKNNKEANIWIKHFPGYSAYGSVGFVGKEIDFEEVFSRFKPIDGEHGTYYLIPDRMPELIGGLENLQEKVVYPEEAKKKGIEGRVVVQFIIDENGKIIDPKVIRGIGGGCDEAALDAISKIEFKPGIKNNKPVKVQFNLPIVFKLTNSDYNPEVTNTFTTDYGNGKILKIFLLKSEKGILSIRVTDKENTPLEGAILRIDGEQQGVISGANGLLTLENLEEDTYDFFVSHPDFGNSKFSSLVE